MLLSTFFLSLVYLTYASAIPVSSSSSSSSSSSTPVLRRLKVLTGRPGYNPTFDAQVQGFFVYPSPGFAGNNINQASISATQSENLTLCETETAGTYDIDFVDDIHLELGPAGSNGIGRVDFESGRKGNDVLAVTVDMTQAPPEFVYGTVEGFSGWVVCTSQYGPYVAWLTQGVDLDAYNNGSPFYCGVVVLQAEKIV